MKEITIKLDDLMDILRDFDIDTCQAKPLDMLSFCQYIFHKYQPERSKREDSEKSLVINRDVINEKIESKGPITFIC